MEESEKVAKNDSIFKVPASPAPKSRKRRVLEEETYLHAMGDIIEKDFFPDLKELRAMHKKLEENRTPYVLPRTDVNSPATFETPGRSPQKAKRSMWGSKEAPSTERNKIQKRLFKTARKITGSSASGLPKLSLDQFVQIYTTEDDESFQKMLMESGQKHRRRHSFMSQNEKALSDLARRLAVPSIEEQAKGLLKPLALDTWAYKNKNALMFSPDGVAQQPNGNAGRLINYMNTSLREMPFDNKISSSQLQLSKESQARALQGKIGIDGKVVTDGNKTPGSYSYMRTPSPMPGVSDSPLMTWGEIGGTPYRIEGDSTPSFRIQQVPKREQIALALADKATVSHRNEKRKAARPMRIPPSPGRDNRFQSMSPAAKRLASSTIGIGGIRSPSISRPSYYRRLSDMLPPLSPVVKRTAFPREPRVIPSRAASNGSDSEEEDEEEEDDITDNLLALVKRSHVRLTAKDFFQI